MPVASCTKLKLAALTVVFVSLTPASPLRAQDTRTVTEPTFPSICTSLKAELTIGGGEPSSETQFDTSRIQSALNACAPGKSVVLVAAEGNNAFLIAPITIPNGVTLIVDGGVTVFASRNPKDYQESAGETCGTLGNLGNGCHALITSSQSSGSGLMGFGVIDGRGKDDLIVEGKTQDYSWYDKTSQAISSGLHQNNPDIFDAFRASSFTLFKITLRNAPHFNVMWEGKDYDPTPTSGLTVWGVKIIAPYTATNTDGIDPVDNVSDITIHDSYISNGDDQIAISSHDPGYSASNISITNLHTYSGRGVSIGSWTKGGISNVLVNTLTQYGNPNDILAAGFRIKSAADRGGVVKNVIFENICQQNVEFPMQFNPYYSPANTGYIPSFEDVSVNNLTVLAISSNLREKLVFQGFDANHTTGVTFNNVNFVDAPRINTQPQYTHFTLGGGPVNPDELQTLTGPGVYYTGSISKSSETAYACSASSFVQLAGELYLSSGSSSNKNKLTVAAGSSFTLNAVIEPASAEYPAPTAPVTFYEAGQAVGQAAIAGNGTLAALALNNLSAGVHSFSAQYPGDSNYPALRFGSVTVTVNGN